jgi:hypothetical protein
MKHIEKIHHIEKRLNGYGCYLGDKINELEQDGYVFMQFIQTKENGDGYILCRKTELDKGFIMEQGEKLTSGTNL